MPFGIRYLKLKMMMTLLNQVCLNTFCTIYYDMKSDRNLIVCVDTGILKFNIHQAKSLDPKFSMVGVYNPYAELMFNGISVFRTKTHRRTNNPAWEVRINLKKHLSLSFVLN